MPDPAQTAIVQKMIDAGESEDNIATVIQHFAKSAPRVGSGPNGFGDPEAKAPTGRLADLNRMLEPLAHPQTAGDFGALLVPSGGGKAVMRALEPIGAAVSKYGGAAAKLAGAAATTMLPPAVVTPARAALKVLGELKPSEWNSPLTVAGREGRAQAAVPAMVDRYKPNTSGAGSGFGDSASAVQGPKQATYAQLPDGSWGLKGSALAPGDRVHVMNRAGVGQIHTVGRVRPDGIAEIAGAATVPPATPPGLYSARGDRLSPEVEARILAQFGKQ